MYHRRIGILTGLSATFALLVSLGLEGCVTCRIDPDLAALEHKNPAADAKEAVSRGDIYFLGVYGFSFTLPGIPGNPQCWQELQGARAIPDTSDAYRCREHGRLQGIARKYAEKYNSTVATELGIPLGTSCAT